MKFNVEPKATYDNGDFELKVDKDISFDWKTGTVGANKNAKIVTDLYDSTGTKL